MATHSPVLPAPYRSLRLAWLRPSYTPLTAAVALAACHPTPGTPGPQACPGATTMVREEIYFGRSQPNGAEVTDSAWAAFLREEVTPRFPDGITVLDARGQWKGRDGRIVQERTWILILYRPVAETGAQAVGALVAAYAARFAQEAVLRDRTKACVSF